MKQSEINMNRKTAVAIPIVAYLAISLLLVVSVLRINGGRFTYTLDDAYIHLALSENIAQGNYGLNLSEVSAPASSILWPFLLVPFVWLGVAEFAPLALNLVFSIWTLFVCGRFLDDCLVEVPAPRKNALLAIGLLCLIPLLNLPALAFTGMEHSLQVLLSILLLTGLARESRTGEVSWNLFAALVLGPLVRYENVALSGPALCYLLVRRKFAFAILAGLVMTATLGAFSAFLLAHGQAYLPTSVIAKSDTASTGGRLAAMLANLHFNIRNRQGTVLGAMLVFMVGAWCLDRRGRKGEPWLAVWGCAAAGMHLLGGSFGWFARYEMYIMGVAILLLVYLYRDALARSLARTALWRGVAVLAVAVIVIAGPYLRRLLITPLAASNIYEQHGQIQRFVKDYWKRPVAAMDVGFVTYGHDYHVLDVRGLGSLEALGYFEKRKELNADWMEKLVDRDGIKLAILYKFYYHVFPKDWTVIGELHLGRRRVIAAFPVVTFYATGPESVPEIRALLGEFSKTLPPGVKLTLR